MQRVVILVVVAIATATTPVAKSQTSPEAGIQKAIGYCLNVVHKTKVPADQSYMSNYYRDFDAFYNPASGKVENNATRNGDQLPLFAFNKCMTQQGFPLTYGQ